ncbi:MAG: hypothetical protein methR_P3100 [Methyloprofundus sp.]|nr:MAG: hypothetical protein methR_P3100 [Methyloprofundus sp.]
MKNKKTLNTFNNINNEIPPGCEMTIHPTLGGGIDSSITIGNRGTPVVIVEINHKKINFYIDGSILSSGVEFESGIQEIQRYLNQGYGGDMLEKYLVWTINHYK